MADLNINYLQQLDDVRNNLAGSHKLLRDLDFNSNASYDQDDVDWETKKTAWTTGTGWTPIGETFTGVFDGQNYAISNLFIDDDSVASEKGLFSWVNGGEIKNLTVSGDITSNGSEIGVICVGHYGGSNIENCHTSGEIICSGITVGGVSAYAYDPITKCSSSVNINGTGGYAGGIVGVNDGGIISQCYATGNIEGEERVGGLVGDNTSTIINCYSTGLVTRLSGEDTMIAGFCGRNYRASITKSYSTGSVHYTGTDDPTDKGFVGAQDTGGAFEDADNFFDSTTSGQATTTGNATAKTTAQMKDIATFSAWDISATKYKNAHIWNIQPTEYPQLTWDTDLINSPLPTFFR